jgi:ATP-binding cassette subfamily B protein
LQESHLFRGSISENIRYGKADATDEEVRMAATEAEIHDFIISLPKGYDTIVSHSGTTLSGGQRQRIAIARALLKDGSVILLDEPTSMLDAVTEDSINKLISKLKVQRRFFCLKTYDSMRQKPVKMMMREPSLQKN